MSSPICKKFPVEPGRAGEKAAGEKKKVSCFVSKVSEFVPESSCKCLFCRSDRRQSVRSVSGIVKPAAFSFSPAVRSWGAAAHRLPVRSSSRPASASVPAGAAGRWSESGSGRAVSSAHFIPEQLEPVRASRSGHFIRFVDRQKRCAECTKFRVPKL